MEMDVTAAPLFTVERLSLLFGFALASTWTPGPNNIMLASSGATHGYRASLPHAFGVALGFPIMLFLISLGLGELFKASPLLRDGLKWAGAALLLWLGWRIATAKRASAETAGSRPFTFLEAAGFQWVNPKAWTMAIGTASIFIAGAAPVLEALTAALVFTVSGIGSSQTWLVGGVAIRRFLSTDLRLRVFNGVMGALVACFVAFLFIE